MGHGFPPSVKSNLSFWHLMLWETMITLWKCCDVTLRLGISGRFGFWSFGFHEGEKNPGTKLEKKKKKNTGGQRKEPVTKQALVWCRGLERTSPTQLGDEWSRPTTFPEVVGRGWRYTTNEYFSGHRPMTASTITSLEMSPNFTQLSIQLSNSVPPEKYQEMVSLE